jgi:hypothetical protein
MKKSTFFTVLLALGTLSIVSCSKSGDELGGISLSERDYGMTRAAGLSVTIRTPALVPGTLGTLRLNATQIQDCAKLTIAAGEMNADDIDFIRTQMPSIAIVVASGITITDGVLPNGAFMGKTTLTEIALPYNLISIPDDAFNGCVNLESCEINIEDDCELTSV